jgi:putative thioredoxin
MNQYILDASAENFSEAVLQNSHKGPVMVNYWAENAGPCLRLWPVLEKLADDYEGRFLLVNVDTNRDRQLASDYGVNSVPTVKLFLNGEVVDQIHGYDSPDSFRKMLDKHLARESDTALAEAVKFYQQGEIGEAFGQLDKLVLLDPANDRIFLTYAKLLMREQSYLEAYQLLEKTPLKTESDDAAVLMANAMFVHTSQQAKSEAELLTGLEKDPDDLQLQFDLCSLRVLHSQFDLAMDILLKLIRQDFTWHNGVASQCLRGLFIMLGKDNPLVREYRQKLIDQQSH